MPGAFRLRFEEEWVDLIIDAIIEGSKQKLTAGIKQMVQESITEAFERKEINGTEIVVFCPFAVGLRATQMNASEANGEIIFTPSTREVIEEQLIRQWGLQRKFVHELFDRVLAELELEDKNE